MGYSEFYTYDTSRFPGGNNPVVSTPQIERLFTRSWRHSRKQESAEQIDVTCQHMVNALLIDNLTPLLLKKEQFFAVKLERWKEPCEFDLGGELIDLTFRLKVNPSQERIIEWVDYRPMDWMTLSRTALEEIRRRVHEWWRRPLSTRLYLFRLWLGVMERRHFGRAFSSTKCP